MNIWMNIFLFLSCYGAVCVAADLGHAIGGLAIRVDKWADYRATLLIGQAILDDEWDRAGNPRNAQIFAHKIMGTRP